MADFRSDVSLADSTGVSAANSTLIRMHQGQYQVPALFAVDSSFVECSHVAWLVAFLELWLVEGVGDWDLVEIAIMKAHLGAHRFIYGDDTDQIEASASMSY